ncbi:DUF2505 domain-containing protein [Nocardia sp. CA-107356]|uniref:DUF2505 domain-containing protein n=1 Tax=Nocardia sp. CA-107356 TaxID=3239972 RepID=UPI003D89F67A
MAQTIRLVSEFSFPAALFHNAQVSTEYWQARVAELDGPHAELSIHRDATGVLATVSKPVAPERIPSRLSKVWPSGLRLDYSEHWSPLVDGLARAEVRADIAAVSTMSGACELRDTADGCVCEYVVTVDSGIPMAGRLIAGAVAKSIIEDSGAVDAFTERWLTARGEEFPDGR